MEKKKIFLLSTINYYNEIITDFNNNSTVIAFDNTDNFDKILLPEALGNMYTYE